MQRIAHTALSRQPIVLERTLVVSGDRLTLRPALDATAPLPLDGLAQLCEVSVSVATGALLQHELDVPLGTRADNASAAVVTSLAALTGEEAHRFAVVAFDLKASRAPISRRQEGGGGGGGGGYARVRVAYLIADAWLTPSRVTAGAVSVALLAASAAQWAAVGPYTLVSAELVSAGGPVPPAYAPVSADRAPPASAARTGSGAGLSTGALVGILLVAFVVVVALVAALIWVVHPVPVWRRESPWVLNLGSPASAAGSATDLATSPATSSSALAPSVGSPTLDRTKHTCPYTGAWDHSVCGTTVQ